MRCKHEVMAEFRFDFVVKDNDVETDYPLETLKTAAVPESTTSAIGHKTSSKSAEELIVDLSAVEDQINPDDIDVIQVGDIDIKYINSTGIEEEIRIEECERDNKITNSDNLAKAILNRSDLISGVYEGGLKVWECSLDLANFLAQEITSCEHLDVLELGCGAGIPGLYLMAQGALVHFQDYNSEVLERLTVPNVIMNQQNRDDQKGVKNKKENQIKQSCRYFIGDWSDMTDVLKTNNIPNKYDVILTSETIYNVSYYERLHDLFSASLKPAGCVYVAAKTHYFGVGGGTRVFEEFVIKKQMFNISCCWKNNEGLQREILKLEFKT
ncbi:histidine protein methyltransferase 1 homolog [Antedon mediterranea]|uniref:histidine protein methyltransferase 1 homolog n=1 Tax=Antedon mediterranea TaxID=105859 RepID=UPI003AF4BB9E